MRDLTWGRRPAIAPHVADYQPTIAEPQLSAMILAYPHSLDEPERCAEPGHRRTDIGIDQDWDDRRHRNGTVALHTVN
jgi:hypothetical protein